MARLNLWLIGGITGTGTSLLFLSFHYALTTTDNVFSGWEFLISLTSPALAAAIVAIVKKATLRHFIMLLFIAYLTFVIPVLGASFGASGSEPIWQYARLGFVGGLFWTTPFILLQFLVNLIRR